MNRHLVIVDPGVKTPELSCFNRIALNSQLSCSLHLPALFGCETLFSEDAEFIAGLILLGSASSVYDDHDWQLYLNHLILEYASLNIPILGICFGHQLIAKVFGGRVDFICEEQTKEIGFQKSKITSNRLINQVDDLEMIVSHREAVVECPEDFSVVGMRNGSMSNKPVIEMVEHQDKPIWGIQSHPESTLDFLVHQNIDCGLSADQITNKLDRSFFPVQQFLNFVAANDALAGKINK